MYTEIVRIDAKGRITIPSYIRLLLDLNEGSEILMDIDEDKGMIVLRAFRKEWIKCSGVLRKDDLIEIVMKTRVINIKCISNLDDGDVYKCNIVLESNGIPSNLIKNMHCSSG